jgi:hypothetical protein
VVDGCASVEEQEDFGFTVYPNPASSYVDVRIDNGLEILSIQLFTIEGKLLQTTNSLGTNNSYKVDLSNVSSGTYLIKVNASSQQIVKKIIVQ